MFYQNFLSPQVKWCVINTYIRGIYQLPRDFPNELKILLN